MQLIAQALCSIKGKLSQEAHLEAALFLIGVKQRWSQENKSIVFYELRSHEDTQMCPPVVPPPQSPYSSTMGEYFKKLNLHNRIKKDSALFCVVWRLDGCHDLSAGMKTMLFVWLSRQE